MMKRFKTFVLTLATISCHIGFAASIADYLAFKYSCALVNYAKVTIKGNICLLQVKCSRSDLPKPSFLGFAVFWNQNRECPKTLEEARILGQRYEDLLDTGYAPTDFPRRASQEICSPIPPDINQKKHMTFAQYHEDGKTTPTNLCFVGASCIQDSRGDREAGVIGCYALPDRIDTQVVNGKNVESPVCPNFDDCLRDHVVAPEGLLNYYKRLHAKPPATATNSVPRQHVPGQRTATAAKTH